MSTAKLVQLKKEDDSPIFPKTSSEAVIMTDGNNLQHWTDSVVVSYEDAIPGTEYPDKTVMYLEENFSGLNTSNKNIIGAINEVRSSLFTPTYINVTLGSGITGPNTFAFRFGNIVVVNLNFSISSTVSGSSTLVSGLPTNATGHYCTAAVNTTGGNSARVAIRGGENFIHADGQLSTTGYYNGQLIYVTA